MSGPLHVSGRTWAQLELPCTGTGSLVDSMQPVPGGMQLGWGNLGQAVQERDSSSGHEEGVG